MPKIDYQREEYFDLKPRWDLVSDCIAGQEKIKEAGDTYLPRPQALDLSPENLARYEDYKARAVFYNVTKRTLQGLLGQVFRFAPTYEGPSILDPLQYNIDGEGVSIGQQSQKALGNVLSYGRCGLWVDYPRVEEETSVRDLEEGNIRPTITRYRPQSIINWRTITIGSITKTSLVVLHETYVKEDDGFEPKMADQWRVLKLDEDTLNYTVTVWIKDPNNDQQFIEKEVPVTPLDASGKPFNSIPFIFLGAENNNQEPDLPPLEDLAILNIAHYRNSADYEEASYVTGQPTPWLAGLTQSWVKDVLKGRVMLGSRGGIMLPEGGSAGLLQVAPNSLPHEAMEAKERQMVALGAKLVEQSTVQRTAKEASIENASETSILAMAANNVSEGYTEALKYAKQFVNRAEEAEIVFKLNTDFESHILTAQDQTQLIANWQMGAILTKEMREKLTKAGIATVDLEDFEAEIEEDLANRALSSAAFLPAGEEEDSTDEQDG